MSLAVPALRINLSRDDLIMRAGVVAFVGVLLLIVGLPLWALLAKGFEDRNGNFVGVANYVSYFSTPALFQSALNSLQVAAVTTVIGAGPSICARGMREPVTCRVSSWVTGSSACAAPPPGGAS